MQVHQELGGRSLRGAACQQGQAERGSHDSSARQTSSISHAVVAPLGGATSSNVHVFTGGSEKAIRRRTNSWENLGLFASGFKSRAGPGRGERGVGACGSGGSGEASETP